VARAGVCKKVKSGIEPIMPGLPVAGSMFRQLACVVISIIAVTTALDHLIDVTHTHYGSQYSVVDPFSIT
jgi:hypothetical protein